MGVVAAALAAADQALGTSASTAQQSFFGGARGLGAAVAAGKFFHAASGVDEFLFASEKRMTSGANADFNIATGGARVIDRATRTGDIGLVILWMNVRFHIRKRARNLRTLSCPRKR